MTEFESILKSQLTFLSILIKGGKKEDAKAVYNNLIAVTGQFKNDSFYVSNKDKINASLISSKTISYR